MTFYEAKVDEQVINQLISFSKDWEAEKSCYGYRANGISSIEGNRVFFAESEEGVLGYLFGKKYEAKSMQAILPDGTPYFEVEELYVIPQARSKGVGAALFRYVEEMVKKDSEYILLSTATKNWKAIFHFYLDELGMEFWNARLFKKI